MANTLKTIQFAQQISSSYEQFLLPDFLQQHFTQEIFYGVLDRLMRSSAGALIMRQVGESFEKRPIQLISAGRGKINVLLWSQMHGDEPTATRAIADILNYILSVQNEEGVQLLLSSLTLHFLPMLNPDGAARIQRRTAQHIDMNRDALVLATPEARMLKSVRDELAPQFGFNLHDQELNTVGTSKELTAIALLAPAFDAQKSDNEVRTRAKHLAAVFTETMQRFIPENIARYDDTFEERAFGDNMQKWGTSTLLIESGHALNDPEKKTVRKLNVVGILSSLYAIATGEYLESDINRYHQLPCNGKKAYDVILRNVTIDYGEGRTGCVDLGVSYQVDTHSEATPRLVDVGDLSTYIGLKEINGAEKKISHSLLTLNQSFEWENHFLP